MSTTLLIILIAVVVVLALFGYGAYATKKAANVKKSSKIKVLDKKNFKLATRKGLMLVDFWASWCNPCKMMIPVLNDIAEDKKNQVAVGKVNVEYQKQLASQYQIRNIPTLILFQDGKEVARMVGFKTKRAIMKQVKEVAS